MSKDRITRLEDILERVLQDNLVSKVLRHRDHQAWEEAIEILNTTPTYGIQELQAGPVLDALISSRVFGFWYTEDDEWGPQWWGPHPVTPGARCYPSVVLDNLWGVHVDQSSGLPKFSTDIEAAWKVVTHFTERGRDVTITARAKRAHVWILGGLTSEGIAVNAETVPLAICQAALKVTYAEKAREEIGWT